MRTIDIIAYSRNIGLKSERRKLRNEGQVLCVIYGTEGTFHASIPGILFRPLLQTQEACFVRINLEGRPISCVLQDIEHHPVSEQILHADFLILSKKPIVMRIPLRTQGQAPGLLQGGNLHLNMRSLRVKSLPQDMPSQIEIDVSELSIGGIIKIKDIPSAPYQIQDHAKLPIVSMQTPRALRSEATTKASEGIAEPAEEFTSSPAP